MRGSAGSWHKGIAIDPPHLSRVAEIEHQAQKIPQSLLHTDYRTSANLGHHQIAIMRAPVLSLLLNLMDVPSVSDDEKPIALFLQKTLEALGFTTKLIPISEGSDRCNVYAYLGDSPKARVCFTCHMDTVPPHIPATIADGIVYGRGACDDKGPMAAQISAAEELRRDGAIQSGDISLLFVVAEEKGGPGMLAANNMALTWDAVIFGEPTESKLAVGHKGHFVFELSTKGIASHSGYPEKGRSANEEMLRALNDLSSLTFRESGLLGPSTYHCARLSGGTAYNVLSARCDAQCAVRIAADLPRVQQLVRQLVSRYPSVTLKESFAYGETLLDHDVSGAFI